MRRIGWCIVVVLLAGCAAESAGRIECRHGDVERDPTRVCIEGRWIREVAQP